MFSSQKYVKQLIFQETGAKLNSLKSPLRISAFQASAKPKLTPSLIRISAFQSSSKPNFLRNLPRVSLKKGERTPINSELTPLISKYDAGRYLNKIDLSPKLIRFSSIFTVILLSILFFSSTQTHAQFYDTIHRPKLEWFEIKTEHFRIIYHEGLDDLAQRSAHILELRYPEIQKLIGGSLNNYPVVINGYNDNGNGYVSTLHFRMEIEAPPITGKILNHVGSDRLDGLLSHELTHALQFSELGSKGFSRFISLFSPDLARSNHGLSPPGFREGLATHVESQLNPVSGGRGNFAPFTNPFYQNITSKNPWNLAQLLTPSSIYRPIDRYYIGGYHFTDWLIRTQQPNLIQKSLHSFANFPLLGYAPHLWYHTGKNPSKLYREFLRYQNQKLDSGMTNNQHHTFESELTTPSTDSRFSIYSINPNQTLTSSNPINFYKLTSSTQIFEDPNQQGSMAYNPIWLNKHEIIYYSTSYSDRPGFYTVDIRTNSHELVYETRIDESFNFELSPDRKKIIYSRYQPHLIFDNFFTTDVYELNLQTLESNRITKKARIRGPSYLNDYSFVALQTNKDAYLPVIIKRDYSTSNNSRYQHGQPEINIVQSATINTNQNKSKNPSIQNLHSNSNTSEATNSLQHRFIPLPNTLNSPQNFVQISVNPVYATSEEHPKKNKTPYSAAIVTSDNQSGIYFSYDRAQPIPSTDKHPNIQFHDSSIFDLYWSPDGTKLLFTVDIKNVLQIFEYRTDKNSIHQLTHGPWNSMEASYSPDGTKIAFISLHSNQRKIVVQHYADFQSIFIKNFNSTSSSASTSTRLPTLTTATISTSTSKKYTPRRYKTDLSWIVPRTIIPVSTKISNKDTHTVGLSFHSSDILRKNTYALDLEYADQSIFYDFKYRYTGIFPGIQINAFHSAYNPGNLIHRDGLEFFGEEREFGMSFPMRLNLDHRNSSNNLIFIPEFLNQSNQIKLIDEINPTNNQTTNWSGSNRIRLFTAFNYRLKQNIRSVDPINGIIIFAQTDVDIHTYNSEFETFSGLRTGFYLYTSPLQSLNHSFRLGYQVILQNRHGYNVNNLIHEGFNQSKITLTDHNFSTISTRYSIPIRYPDTGGILIPAFVESYYLSLFSESIVNSQFEHLHSVVGVGIRGKFRFFYNIVFDVGIGLAVDPFNKGSETIVLNF